MSEETEGKLSEGQRSVHRPDQRAQIEQIIGHGRPLAMVDMGFSRLSSADLVKDPAPPGSPESNQIEMILRHCTDDGALPDKPDHPIYLNAFKQLMPYMPVDAIKAALLATSGEAKNGGYPSPCEAWEILFLDQGLMQSRANPFRGAEIWGQDGCWTVINSIGVGTEANVLFGQKKGGGQAAIKIFKGSGPDHARAFQEEVKAHLVIRKLATEGAEFPHLVRMLDYNRFLRTVIMDRVTGYPLDKLQSELEKDITLDWDSQEIKAAVEKANEATRKALSETEESLANHKWKLGDVQNRNIMYNPLTEMITFVDISLNPL